MERDARYQGREVSYRSRPKLAIGPVLFLLLLVNLAANLCQLPLNRLVERLLCREYYSTHDPSVVIDEDIPEKLCKVDAVQQELAWILGVIETWWILGDFIVTIPLGFLAERYGRKPILLLNLIPRIFMLLWAIIVGQLDLAPKALVAAPMLSILGGDCLFSSLVLSLAAGMTDDSVIRATYFSWISAISYVVSFTAPSLAAATMSVKLSLPFWIGLCLLLLAAPTVSFLPAPGPAASIGTQDDEQQRPLISSPTLKARSSDPPLRRLVMDRFRLIATIVRRHPRNLILLLTSFFLTSLASSDTKLLPQVISKRYDWTFSSAGYLLSAKAVVNFLLLSTVIPWLLRSSRSSGQASAQLLSDRHNVRYARICLAVSVLGALAISFAATIWLLVPSLLLYALGSALPVFTLGLLKSPSFAPQASDVSSQPEAHVFSIATMVKTFGSLVGAPLMATLWVQGITNSTFGFPFLISAMLYASALCIFFSFTIA